MVQVSIASGSQISADVGAAIAARGGNAVDAAIGAALASICTEPGVIAPGASGFLTIWPRSGEPVVIDAYGEMPGRGLAQRRFGQAATKVFLNYGGGMETIVGYGSVATPGAFAGFGLAAQAYGAIPWSEVVAPTIAWIERGFPLPAVAAEYLADTHQVIFGWHPTSYGVLHHADGSYLKQGELVHIPDLAKSLQAIAREGSETFYQGELGWRIATDVQVNGGLLTAADLEAYRAISRPPIRIQFDDWQVATNPPPAVGGACLAAMLLLLAGRSFAGWTPEAVQYWLEIQEAVLNYRNHHLQDGATNGEAAAKLLELAAAGDTPTLLKSPSTIHTSAVDSEGLACSVSLSAGYGSGVMVPGTGLWLNNSLGELELHPQSPQGMLPGTRLISNMAPTIARREDGAVLAIGSPGASRITTAIAQVLFNFLHLGMSLKEAIAHPRLHVEVFDQNPAVAFEPGLSLELKGLLGRPFPRRSMYFGGVQAAVWTPKEGLSEAADPRRAGGVARGGR